MEQQYFTIKQTAELLGVSRSTIRRRIEDGTFTTYKYFGRPMIPRRYIFGDAAEQRVAPVQH